VGDSDGECPTPQSYEFWHALKTLGVETKLVVYEHEGHMFVSPGHQRDRIRRTVAWFDAHPALMRPGFSREWSTSARGAQGPALLVL